MIRKSKGLIYAILTLALVFCTASAFAAESAPTKEQAKAMVEKAIAFHKASGREATLAELAKKDGKFVKGPELYAFAIDLKGNVLAHPFNPALVGKDMSNVKDADGRAFSVEMGTLGSTQGSGWVNYKWTNPASKKTEPKTSYLQRADDYIIVCGIYVK